MATTCGRCSFSAWWYLHHYADVRPKPEALATLDVPGALYRGCRPGLQRARTGPSLGADRHPVDRLSRGGRPGAPHWPHRARHTLAALTERGHCVTIISIYQRINRKG